MTAGSETRREDAGPDPLIVIDGGVGSELRRRGIALSKLAWSGTANVTAGDVLTEVHSDYIRAGADVITANTFGTSRFVLEAASLGDRFREINTAAIDAALRARDASATDVKIAASLSCLPPRFDPNAYPAEASELDAYRELVGLFEDQGVELIMLEMMQDARHAALACQAASESDLPFWLGVSCRLVNRPEDSAKLTAFDSSSTDLVEILDALLRFGPDAVNIMHSPVDAMRPALVELKKHWSGSVGVYAEIPYPEDPERRASEPADRVLDPQQGARARPAALVLPVAYAEAARAWVGAGARIVGGCCGTTPEHIAALGDLRHAAS